MDKQKNRVLPTYGFYRRNCHSSHGNILCYLSSTTEIKVIRFTKNGDIDQQSEIKIPQQPVKGIRVFSISDQLYYIGVAFISRFMIYENGNVIYEGNLSLNCNISQFTKGFCGVSVLQTHQESCPFYFVFLTKNGDIIMFDVVNKNKILKTPRKYSQNYFQAFTTIYPNVYLATDKGSIIGVKLIIQNEHYQQIGKAETNSGYPILQLVGCSQMQQIYCATAQGQILILSKDLSKTSVISAHHCLICRILVSGKRLYTFGEDCIMHIFSIVGDRKLEIEKTSVYDRLPSLLFKITSGNYLTFYQNPKMVAI